MKSSFIQSIGGPQVYYPKPTYDHPRLPAPSEMMPQPYKWNHETGYWVCTACGDKNVTEGHEIGKAHKKKLEHGYGAELTQWRCHPECKVCYPLQMAIGYYAAAGAAASSGPAAAPMTGPMITDSVGHDTTLADHIEHLRLRLGIAETRIQDMSRQLKEQNELIEGLQSAAFWTVGTERPLQ